MSGINEIQARVQSIQNRVTSPPMTGRFGAIFQAQLAAAHAQTAATTTVDPDAQEFVVKPEAASATTQPLGSQVITLGVMLGMTAPPAISRPSGTVYTADELQSYLAANQIEARNGRLASAELQEVSGSWNGNGSLLPPAAAAWEEMRTAAAADGIELQAIDLYRSWESQNGAYQAHLRGDKKANVLPPGESEHGNGLAVDLTNGHLLGTADAEYSWMKSNGATYGWYPISNESWHWEFRGTSA